MYRRPPSSAGSSPRLSLASSSRCSSPNCRLAGKLPFPVEGSGPRWADLADSESGSPGGIPSPCVLDISLTILQSRRWLPSMKACWADITDSESEQEPEVRKTSWADLASEASADESPRANLRSLATCADCIGASGAHLEEVAVGDSPEARTRLPQLKILNLSIVPSSAASTACSSPVVVDRPRWADLTDSEPCSPAVSARTSWLCVQDCDETHEDAAKKRCDRKSVKHQARGRNAAAVKHGQVAASQPRRRGGKRQRHSVTHDVRRMPLGSPA